MLDVGEIFSAEAGSAEGTRAETAGRLRLDAEAGGEVRWKL
jgi:hypothetical protein